jgi:hypothetical protein
VSSVLLTAIDYDINDFLSSDEDDIQILTKAEKAHLKKLREKQKKTVNKENW